MSKERLYDITEVCRMLGTTSRTLRFYEEKGIIKSTTLGLSSRRQYTEEQLSHIRNVLVLRALGLSVKAISDLQSDKSDLKDAVLSKRAEIYASIDSRIKEINLLNEAICALESGKNIFDSLSQESQFDEKYPNKIYSYVKFSKLGLKITFVFYGGMIDGLWLGYYDISGRR